MKKLLVLVALLGVLLAAYKMLPLSNWINTAVNAIGAWGFKGALLYAILYALFTVLLIPGSLLTLAAGSLYGLFWGYWVVTLGAMGGVALSFVLGKGLFKKKINQISKKYPKFENVNRAISQRGPIIVFLMRLSPVFPFNISNYLFSLSHVHYGKYLLVSWIGMLPGTILYVYIGKLGAEVASRSEGVATARTVILGVGLAAALAVTVFVTRLAKNSLNRKLSES